VNRLLGLRPDAGFAVQVLYLVLQVALHGGWCAFLTEGHGQQDTPHVFEQQAETRVEGDRGNRESEHAVVTFAQEYRPNCTRAAKTERSAATMSMMPSIGLSPIVTVVTIARHTASVSRKIPVAMLAAFGPFSSMLTPCTIHAKPKMPMAVAAPVSRQRNAMMQGSSLSGR